MRNKDSNSLRGSIEQALEYAEKMISKEKYSAAFKDETKDEIKTYVCTWLLPPLRRAYQKVNRQKRKNG